jgi:hypothetical protein
MMIPAMLVGTETVGGGTGCVSLIRRRIAAVSALERPVA